MSFRSSTSSFRRSLVLGAALGALFAFAVDRAPWPSTAYFGGPRLAEKHERIEALLRKGTVPVMTVGASYLDQGFDARHFTELTGVTACNMAVAGTDNYQQALYVRHVLVPLYAPELIFWSVGGDGVRGHTAINQQYLDSEAMRRALWPAGHLLVDLEHRLPHAKKRRLIDWFVERDTGRDPDTVDEYGLTVTSTDQRPARGPKARGRRMDYESEVTEDEARVVFEDTLRYCKEQGVRVVMVRPPYLAGTYGRDSLYVEKALTGQYAPYYEWWNETLARYDVPVLNVRYCEISENPRMFFDSKHLNSLGAVPMAEILADYYRTGEIPERWRGILSRAEIEAALGTYDAALLPTLEVERPVRVTDLLGAELEGLGLASVRARVVIEEAGDYGIALSERKARAKGSYFVRIGEGRYHIWELPATQGRAARRTVSTPTAFRLEPGEYVVELHARKTPIPDERFAVVRFE